jgi:hypothetical protein
MPDINLIPEVLHNAMDPYHYEYDNIPLRNILDRQELINNAVDINSAIVRDAAGTAGTLANRLAQSLDDDGSLLEASVNEVYHNIAYHTDGSISSISFVRMLEDERDKLALISDEATALQIRVQTPSTEVTFDDETIELEPSSTITWEITAPNTLKAHTALPTTAAHQHYYGLTPVMVSGYTSYKTTSTSTAFIDGSLRIFINGVRIYSDDTVYVPDSTNTTWTLTSFTPTPTAGTFVLNRAITASDVIRIDFDISLV